MKAIMIGNVVIELCWICATVYLVTLDHHWWATATFVAALISGYGYKTEN